MVRIEHCEFGQIVVDGEEERHDPDHPAAPRVNA
jgi:hypothetical protein